MKHVGFLTRNADGVYVRVHHFARQFASQFPLLAVIGARTEADLPLDTPPSTHYMSPRPTRPS